MQRAASATLPASDVAITHRSPSRTMAKGLIAVCVLAMATAVRARARRGVACRATPFGYGARLSGGFSAALLAAPRALRAGTRIVCCLVALAVAPRVEQRMWRSRLTRNFRAGSRRGQRHVVHAGPGADCDGASPHARRQTAGAADRCAACRAAAWHDLALALCLAPPYARRRCSGRLARRSCAANQQPLQPWAPLRSFPWLSVWALCLSLQRPLAMRLTAAHAFPRSWSSRLALRRSRCSPVMDMSPRLLIGSHARAIHSASF